MDFPPRPREAPPEPAPRARARRGSGAGPPTEPPPSPPHGPTAEPRSRRRPRRETLARIGVAVPWIALAIFIVAVGGIPFAIAMIGFAFIGLSELFRMTRRYRPMPLVAFATAAGMVVAAYYGTQFQMVLVGAAAFPAMFAVALRRNTWRGITHSMAMTAFGIAWIGIPFAHAVLLRELPAHGGALVIDVLVGTFVTDTAAYAGGRLFGRRRLAPTVSPNKTVEGLAFGLVGGTMGFWFAGLYQDWLTGVDALIMGACIAVFAVVGDLFESMVKRDLGIKDSGNVFGPHGGLLDRLDALLFTIVIGYYLAVAFVY
jgi:phosphatidate cytidylyltransferase